MSNVGYATLSIIPSAKGFGAALSKDTDAALLASGRSGGERMGRGITGGVLPAIKGLAGPLAAVFAVDKIGGFFKDAISQASDLNEAGTKLQQVFQGATGDVLSFASKGAKGLGQSALDVQNAAATFGVYGAAAGLAGKANADFSTQLVSLSTDLASFYNTDPSQAMQAIASGLRGEAEPLRQYGVLLDDASMRQEALRLGLIKTTKSALTPQQRVLAAQSLIMKQTTVAQGDFARTSGGLANQQRILSAQFTDLKGKVGAGLLPVMVKLTTLATTVLLPGVEKLGGVIGRTLGPALGKIKEGFGGIFSILAHGDFKGMAATFGLDEDSAVVGFLFNVRDAVKSLATVITTQAVPTIQRLVQSFMTNVLPVLQTVAGFIVTTVVPAVIGLATWIGQNLVPVAVGIYTVIATQIIPALATFVGNVLSAVMPAVQGLIARIQENKEHFQAVFNVVKTVIGVFAEVVGFIVSKLAPILGTILGGAFKLVIGIIGAAIGIVGGFIGAIGKIVTTVVNVAKGIKDGFQDAVDFTKRIFNDLLGFFQDLPGKIAGFFKGVWHNITEDLKSAINSILHLPLKIPEIKIGAFGHYATVGGQTLLPALAQGGIATGPTVAMIGEGTEPEAVLPLSKLRGLLGDTGRPAHNGPLIGTAYINETVDADVLAKRLDFALGSNFGGGSAR